MDTLKFGPRIQWNSNVLGDPDLNSHGSGAKMPAGWSILTTLFEGEGEGANNNILLDQTIHTKFWISSWIPSTGTPTFSGGMWNFGFAWFNCLVP